MSSCIAGREVVLRLRRRTTGHAKTVSVVCPAAWTKGRLLAYVRREHPNESVVIVDWKPVSTEDDRWYTRLWIVNPDEMIDRRRTSLSDGQSTTTDAPIGPDSSGSQSDSSVRPGDRAAL